jgi:hypothetical protein
VKADEIAIKVDRNFGYAVFVSYAEVYNEKVRRGSLLRADDRYSTYWKMYSPSHQLERAVVHTALPPNKAFTALSHPR